MNNTASKEFDWDSSHDLLDLIVQKISDDPDGMDSYIIELYEEGNEAQRKMINQVLIALCGFSFLTLVNFLGNQAGILGHSMTE